MQKRSVFKVFFKRKSKSELIVQTIFFLLMAVHCFALIYLYFYGFNISLKESQEKFSDSPYSLAFELNFMNYAEAFKSMKIELLGGYDATYFDMVFNSLWYAVGGQLFSIFVAACSTYVVARFKNKFTKFIFNLCVFIMIMPIVAAGPARYRLYADLNILNTPFILLEGLNNMCNLMMYAFFSALPWSYAEAAYIDGANDFTVFFKIMLPMALPSISVIFVSGVIAAWNDYATPMLYLDERFPTLASGLYAYERDMQYDANVPAYFAGVCLAMIPPITIFSLMQNTIMSKVYFGGLKG